MQVYGIDAIIRIVSHLAFIYLAFWSLRSCLLYTSDAADEEDSVDLGGRRIIKKKNRKYSNT